MEPKKTKSNTNNQPNQPQYTADKQFNEPYSKVQFTPSTTTVPQKNSPSSSTTYTPQQNQPYNQQQNSQYPQFQSQCQPPSSKQKGQQYYTKIVVRCNAGFGNSLYLRGEGVSNLSWQQGSPMKNVKADEWYWETNQYFTTAQFKVLFNDKQYEVGDNHWVECGKTLTFIPYF